MSVLGTARDVGVIYPENSDVLRIQNFEKITGLGNHVPHWDTTQRTIRDEVEEIKDTLEQLKAKELPKIWVPRIGQLVYFKEDVSSHQPKEHLATITQINGYSYDLPSNGETHNVLLQWVKTPIPYIHTYQTFCRNRIRLASPEEVLAKQLKDSEVVHTLKEGDVVYDLTSASNRMGVVVAPISTNDVYVNVRWDGDIGAFSVFYKNIRGVAVADLMAEQKKERAESTQREAALKQQLADQHARTLSIEERFLYFLNRIEELEKKGEIAQSQIQEIERKELLPVLHTMSKREKIKFLMIQIGKKVGTEILKKMVKDLGLDLSWIARFIGM